MIVDRQPTIDGQSLIAARVNKGFSRRELARHLDVPEQSIRRLENGLGITPGNAKKIADFFGVKVTDLMPLEDAA